MFKKLVPIFLIVTALLSLTGCAVNRTSATVTPGTDLAAMKTFYVVQTPNDKFGVAGLIKADLIKRGYNATVGPDLKQPYQADAVVTYVDKWMWDITMYLLELTVTVRNPSDNFPVAVGNSYHTSLTRLSPPEMVSEVMTNIYKKETK